MFPAARRIAGLVLAFSPALGATEWRYSVNEEQLPVAACGNAEAALMRVYRAPDAQVYVQLDLPPGLAPLGTGACPTVEVDGGSTAATRIRATGCAFEARAVAVPGGRIEDGVLVSPLLAALRRGSRVAWRYRYAYGGYGETAFGLEGSKQRLDEVLGDGVRVVER